MTTAIECRPGIVDVDSLERGCESVRVALAGGFAVRHDVEPGGFLDSVRGVCGVGAGVAAGSRRATLEAAFASLVTCASSRHAARADRCGARRPAIVLSQGCPYFTAVLIQQRGCGHERRAL